MEDTVGIMSPDEKYLSSNESKYLTFTLAEAEYGVSILNVKEIIGMIPITVMPNAPDYVKGVINLRGTVSPVVDMRMKFGMTESPYTERTCIIMVEISDSRQKKLTGIIVDSVSEVMNIKKENIEPTPEFGGDLNMEFILGIAKMEGLMKILLNIDRALNTDEIAVLSENNPNDVIIN